jgi:hypothetical protein
VRDEPLDCVGSASGNVGKHDFVLNRRTPESKDRYFSDKIIELIGTQKELAAVMAERDALKAALEVIASWNEGPEVTGGFDEPCATNIARSTLAQLESGELRK